MNHSIQSEIDDLRAEIAALTQRVDQRRAPLPRESVSRERTKPADEDGADQASFTDQARELAEQWHMPELTEQLGQALADFAGDVKGSKPRALLGAFVAGFLAGKLLSR